MTVGVAATHAAAFTTRYSSVVDFASSFDPPHWLVLLFLQVSEDSAAAMALINASIHTGGSDGGYTASMTYEGASGFADLRPYDKPVDFIGQAIHTSLPPNFFNDSVSFTIAPTATGSKIKAFSYSLIAGAFCDDGQNYYNIISLLSTLPWSSKPEVVSDVGCPAPEGL